MNMIPVTSQNTLWSWKRAACVWITEALGEVRLVLTLRSSRATEQLEARVASGSCLLTTTFQGEQGSRWRPWAAQAGSQRHGPLDSPGHRTRARAERRVGFMPRSLTGTSSASTTPHSYARRRAEGLQVSGFKCDCDSLALPWAGH